MIYILGHTNQHYSGMFQMYGGCHAPKKSERYVSDETFCVHILPPALQNGLCCSEVKRLWSAAVIWAWCSCSEGVGEPGESCLLPMEFTSLFHCLLDLGEVALAGRSHLQMNRRWVVKAPPEVKEVDLSVIIAVFSGWGFRSVFELGQTGAVSAQPDSTGSGMVSCVSRGQ